MIKHVVCLSVLKNSANEFNIKADILMERLRSLADGKTSFKLFPEINHATLDVIATVKKFTSVLGVLEIF